MVELFSSFVEAVLALPWFLMACIFAFSTAAIVLLGQILVRKEIAMTTLKANHEVAGITFGIIGVIYGVILGFTIPTAQERYNAAHLISEVEASVLADLFRDAAVFPEEKKREIREGLKAYVKSVIDDEWPALAYGRTTPATQSSVQKIWDAYYTFEPRTAKDNIWYAESISKLNNFNTTRLSRLNTTHETLGSMMWSLLILGAFIMAGFMYFFALENIGSQMLITAMLTITIAYMLFLLFALDHPFSGQQKLEPVAMKNVLQLFQRWEN